MVQKKKTAGAKTTRASARAPAKSGKVAGSKSSDKSKSIYKRSTAAVISLLLCLFSFLGYFDVDGWFITYFFGFIKGVIGVGYYVFPPALLLCTIILVFGDKRHIYSRIVCVLLTPLFFAAFCHLFLADQSLEFTKEILSDLYTSGKVMQSGGFLGGLLAISLRSAVSIYGAYPVLFVGFVLSGMGGLGISISKLILKSKIRRRIESKEAISSQSKENRSKDYVYRSERRPHDKTGDISIKNLPKAIDIPLDDPIEAPKECREGKGVVFNTKPRVKTPDQIFTNEPENREDAAFENICGTASQLNSDGLTQTSSSAGKKISREELSAETNEIKKSIQEKDKNTDAESYKYPPLPLLNAQGRLKIEGREEIALNHERLESTIQSFGVSGSIIAVTRGPTVTRYDLELDQGVKLSKVTSLAGDLALSLGVSSVRIAPIPNKISTVGIEVPNKIISTVYLRNIIDSNEFKNAKSKLAFSIGEDIGGNMIVGNIAKLPHLLIAGTTGSGKSVCMNSLIISLLYKATPEEVRLIMIDPKMVELGVYNGVPHLYIPVVTDPKKAAGALQWAVVEMLKRYRLFSEVGARDISAYNTYLKNNDEQILPRVVIVIDELADLMLVASKEVEESVCRVAQMGRASGMHLVIATQRPSADVITGLMKANIPSRIAFAVSSAMESRIILDSSGAEKLIGAGDMLYFPLGAGKPLRVQGAFVSDQERQSVIDYVKENAETEYSEDIIAQIEKAVERDTSNGQGKTSVDQKIESEYDELLPQAVDVIFGTKQASISMLQRRLKLGYARAARIVDQMEELGVVGPFEGSKPRQILINKQQWQEMQTIQGTAPIGEKTEQPNFSGFEDDPSEEWKD